MTRPTKKLTGPSLHRFFRRFYRAQADLDAKLADKLATTSSRAFSSVRIRRVSWRAIRQAEATTRTAETGKPAASQSAPAPAAPAPAAPAPTANRPEDLASPAAGKFDPYAFGLVPIYQREGREALLTKLATVDGPDNLRKMAKAQQIALPADLRTGDIPLETLRDAIADAVQKRIANRRAAAG